MPFSSHGSLRATGRKAANALQHNHNHSNGQGSGGTSRALHIPANLPTHGEYSVNRLFTTTLEQIRPRNPPHRLFSSSRNLLARLFTNLAAPGFKFTANFPLTPNNVGSRSLHSGFSAGRSSIQSGLSFPARYAIRNKTLGVGTFLPRSPVPVRGPVATQMGLGTARNFSSSRPIFQNLVDNVPIAVRALYEADLDVELNGRKKGLKRAINIKKSKSVKGGQKMKAIAKQMTSKVEKDSKIVNAAELEQYFSSPAPASVTTYLLIPLAPTPTNRVPLSALELPSMSAPLSGRHPLLSLPEIGALHASHSTHALRVSTIFARLDQANVWSRGGILCSAFSGNTRKVTRPGESEHEEDLEGVCTILKVEFTGWTKAEVRGVIGESGTGWCVLDEIYHAEEAEDEMLSAAEDEGSDYSASSFFSSPPSSNHFDTGMRSPAIDPSQSFVLPTLDFSSSFLASTSRNAFASEDTLRQADPDAFSDFEDPWMDELEAASGPGSLCSSSYGSPMSSSSRSSSSSSFDFASHVESHRSSGLGLIVDPPSENGWFGFSSRFYDASAAARSVEQLEPRETVF